MTSPIQIYWTQYLSLVKEVLTTTNKNFILTEHHYADMMQSYINKVSVKDAAKRVMALKLEVPTTKKPKSTKKTEKVYL